MIFSVNSRFYDSNLVIPTSVEYLNIKKNTIVLFIFFIACKVRCLRIKIA